MVDVQDLEGAREEAFAKLLSTLERVAGMYEGANLTEDKEMVAEGVGSLNMVVMSLADKGGFTAGEDGETLDPVAGAAKMVDALKERDEYKKLNEIEKALIDAVAQNAIA